MIKRIVFVITILSSIALSHAQNLNEYKYVIVPNRYEFLKETDQYKLNSLTQFLFQKYGFTAIMKEEVLPKDVINNGCLVLNANVLNDSGMFNTKLKVELKNCKGEVVYTSPEGTSREKKYNIAYNQALRAAFKSFEELDYKYVPSEKALVSAKIEDKKEEEIKKLKEEIKALKETEVKEDIKVVEKVKKEVKKQIQEPVEKVVKKPTTNKILYAQPTSLGFQLVDTTPRVVYTIFSSGREDVYIVKGLDAVIYKDGNRWIIAEQKEAALEKETLNIKF
jgi:hypothetical protein